MSPDALLTRDVTPAVDHVQYQEVRLDISGDPLWITTRLIESGISETHVLYEQPGSWSVGLGSLAEVSVTPDQVIFSDATGRRIAREWGSSPIDRVNELLNEVRVAGWRAYGWSAFELAYAHVGLTELLHGEPLLHLVVPHTEVRIADGRAEVRSTRPEVLDTVTALLAKPAEERSYEPRPVDVRENDAQLYRDSVAAAVAEIGDRDYQKVILSRKVPVEHEVDLVGTYVVGRQRNNPARSFLLSIGGLRAAGFSPEIVVEVDEQGWVTTQPLAGTRELTALTARNEDLRSELLNDTKEIFEHAISVKVAWDELAELCVPDSVVVNDFMTIKERGSVQHLASSVSGQLPTQSDAWQAFGALFPAVTASGVPKKEAYAAIHRHEPYPRGLYSGAVLTVDQSGALDAALVLRTIFERDGHTWLRAGAGIVEQSKPEREFEETCEKLRSVALHVVPAEKHAAD